MTTAVMPFGGCSPEHSTSQTSLCSRFGHAFKVIHDGLSEIGKKLLECVKKVFQVLGKMRMDASTFGRMIELGINAFSAVELSLGTPGIFSSISSRLIAADQMVDTLNSLDAVHYFGAGKHKQNSVYKTLASVAFLTAGVAAVILLLAEVSLISLAKIGSKLGQLPVFECVAKSGFTIGKAFTAFVGIGYLFNGGDAIHRLVKAKTFKDKAQAGIDLVWSVTEVAHKSLILLGVTNAVALLIMGSTAIVMGITSFLHDALSKENQKKPIHTSKLPAFGG